MKTRQNLTHLFRDLHVTSKLIAAFCVMAAITATVSYQGLKATELLNARATSLFNHEVLGISAIKEAAIFQVKCTRVLRDIVLATGDKDAIEDQKQVLEELQASVKESLDAALQTAADAKSKSKLAEVRQKLPLFSELASKVIEFASHNDPKKAQAALKETNSLANGVNLTIAEVCRMLEDSARSARAECEATYRRVRLTMWACAACAVAVGIFLSLLITRLIARPLQQVMKVLVAAAHGDLTHRLQISGKDEVGQMAQALNQALESTERALRDVTTTTGALRSASQKLASAADGLAAGSQEQAASLEQTSASLAQVTNTARHNADYARQANQIAQDSRESAQQGHTIVTAAVTAMNEISVSSERIGNIVEVVDSVSFQTNLLAVNASIEAARAGDEGRSFAVVAAEIRALSQRSASSAAEIKQLIEDSLRTVARGAESVNRSGQTLQKVVGSVQQVTDFVSNIASASQEQSSSVEQVYAAITQMDQITHSTSTQADQLSLTAQLLSGQAAQLQETLARFKLSSGTDAKAAPHS